MALKKSNEKPSYDKPSTIIGEDTVVESSKLISKASVQVNGKFIGDLEVASSLVVGQSGRVEGGILAGFVLVAGEIVGNIEVTQQIHLTKTARISGDIICQSIVIDEGAQLEGQCKMKKTNNEAPKAKAPKK